MATQTTTTNKAAKTKAPIKAKVKKANTEKKKTEHEMFEALADQMTKEFGHTTFFLVAGNRDNNDVVCYRHGFKSEVIKMASSAIIMETRRI